MAHGSHTSLIPDVVVGFVGSPSYNALHQSKLSILSGILYFSWISWSDLITACAPPQYINCQELIRSLRSSLCAIFEALRLEALRWRSLRLEG